jgi:AcrR family transcriptional regulator
MLTDQSINESAEPHLGRRQQADQRREQLLEAALELFAERGWAGSRISDLAARLGVAHGLVYHYFPSKQALLQAVIEHYSFLPELRRLVTVAGQGSALEVLSEVVRRFDALLTRRGELVHLLMHSAAVVPEVAAARRELGSEGIRLVAGYLRARVAAGELRPHNTQAAARMIMSPVIMAHVAGHPLDGWIDDLVPQLLDGLRPETE